MPFPKLSPLQSRLAASLIASILVLMLYLTLSSSHFAYASEIDSINPQDHNHERLLSPYILEDELEDDEHGKRSYEPNFYGTDRGIIGRAPEGVTGIGNNGFDMINVVQNTTVNYMVTNATLWGPRAGDAEGLPSPVLELRRRNGDGVEVEIDGEIHEARDVTLQQRQLGTRTLYITLNTCLQPYNPNDTDGSNGPPPPVELYVSQSASNSKPGPDSDESTQQKVIAQGGFANVTVEASGDVFIGIYAPATEGYIAPYNVQIAASIDAPFHSYNTTDPNLYLVDSDANSALLVTNNLTTTVNGSVFDDWINLEPPFVVFATNQKDSVISGVQNSYCGLEKYAQIAGTKDGVRTSMVQTSMNNVTLGPFPKQQFYFQGLNESSSYYGILGMTGNSTMAGNGVVGGGGRIWKTMDFKTQTDGNCAVIFNLSFCDSVAYAVPGNPNTFTNVTSLAQFYDNNARDQYQFFKNAMAQIPCEITSSGQYSLARTCNDCLLSYKDWLCSVTIPRCMDFSATASWLHERNIVQPFPNGTSLDDTSFPSFSTAKNALFFNSSRNPNIDEIVKPGPYKEILPCNDLCYNIVQSCPAAMGFSCPQPSQLGFNHSYGLRPNGSTDQRGAITCNYPGAAYNLSIGVGLVIPFAWIVIASGSLAYLFL